MSMDWSSSLDNPASYPRVVPGLFAPTSHSGANDHNFGESIFPGTSTSHNNAKDYGSDFGSSNQSIKHHLIIDMDNHVQSDYYPNVPLFVYYKPTGGGTFACTHKERTVMSLNFYLQTVEGRRESATWRNASELFKRWRCVGVGVHIQSDSRASHNEKDQTIVMAKRVKMLNLMSAQEGLGGTPVASNMKRVWLVARRYVYIDPLAGYFADKSASERQAELDNYPEHRKRAGTEHQNDPRKKSKANTPDYYYQVELYTAVTPPGRAIFGKYGDKEYLGLITDCHGARMNTARQTQVARECLHPIDEADQCKLLNELDHVEINLFIY